MQSLNEAFYSDNAVKIVARKWTRHAGISLIFDSNQANDASVLMIQRAKHVDDPWSGHMAFPGGRKENTDHSTLDAAKRETREEVGFDIDAAFDHVADAQYMGRFSDISMRGKKTHLLVSPFAFLVAERPNLLTNYEVADYVWVPLAQLRDYSNRKQFEFRRESFKGDFPCYPLGDDRLLWGMSLAVLDELFGWLGDAIPWVNELDRL